MSWDWHFAASIMPDLLWGTWITVVMTIACSAVALAGGLIIALMRMASGRPGAFVIAIAVDFLRGVPLLVFLFFGFYALPEIGVTLPASVVGIVILGTVYAAYCSEVYRGALLAIPPGLREAATALSLPWPVVWLRILIPLAIRSSIPALVNYVLVLFKQTSFLFAIGVPVLIGQAQVAGYQSFRYLEPYTLAGLLYILLNVPVVLLARRFMPQTPVGG